jgi:hypothetical protein
MIRVVSIVCSPFVLLKNGPGQFDMFSFLKEIQNVKTTWLD